MKSFELKFTFDGGFLHTDYCDGSDVEIRACPNKGKLIAEVKEAIETALSPEEPEEG